MIFRALIALLVSALVADAAHPAEPRAFEVSVALTIERPDDEPLHRSAAFTLRLSDQRFRLELGQVIVVGERDAEQATLLAWHLHDPESVFIDRDPHLPALVRRDLPPIWCGLLADWLAESDLSYPLAAREWIFLPRREDSEGVAILESPGLRYERSAAADSPLSERIIIARSTGEERLEITYRPIDAGDPADWTIDPAARQPVASIASLRPQPARFSPGQTVSLRLFKPEGQAWQIASVFEPEPSAFQRRTASAMVLALGVVSPRASDLDPSIDPADSVTLLTDLRTRVAGLSAQRALARPLFVARPVILFDATGFKSERLDTVLAAAADLPIDELLPEIEAAAPRVLWSQPPRETIDLFCPGARSALIILDPQRRLLAAIRVDDQRKAAVETAARVILGVPPDEVEPDPD